MGYLTFQVPKLYIMHAYLIWLICLNLLIIGVDYNVIFENVLIFKVLKYCRVLFLSAKVRPHLDKYQEFVHGMDPANLCLFQEPYIKSHLNRNRIDKKTCSMVEIYQIQKNLNERGGKSDRDRTRMRLGQIIKVSCYIKVSFQNVGSIN